MRSRVQWTAAAPSWEREGDLVAASTRAVTAALVEMARLAPGMRVLDVAGGTGDPTTAVAAAVGERGRVVCTDLTPAMLAGARRRIAPAPVRFVAAGAEALPFPAATFDAVVCRFGVMLFADPARGVREMLRVARPGGTVAAAVWGSPERNPYLAIPIATIARMASVPPQDPDAPGVFRLAAPGALDALFAGARDPRVERRAFTMEAPIALADFWPFLLRLASPLRAVVSSLPPALQDAIGAAIRDAVAPYFDDAGMHFPAEMIVARATRI
ncbi:MAG TPA: class I SAM-dependent methyltransferase [Candidatus Binatia bacterium]|nr:class I SAM-dependent methyltransferase [Candidatus Binatia bacterium]